MSIKKVMKSVLLTILFPALIFVVMLLIVRANGITYYGTSWQMWRAVLVNTCTTSVAALALWLQIKNGRFDFSGGATMLLATIIAVNISVRLGSNPLIFAVICIAAAVVLSLITGLIYVYGRLPIIICTIGVALVYESVTYLVFGGRGLNIMSSAQLTIFGRMPLVPIVMAIAAAVFILFCNFTTEGKRAKVLAGSQQVGVNIGISENKNVLCTFLCCGILLGLAGIIYGSQNNIAPQSALSTANTLFAYIIPAYMGMVIGLAGNDAIGVIMAAFGMELFNFGLSCIGLGQGGYQQIILGVFMLAFYGITARLPLWAKKFSRMKRPAN